MESDFAHLVKDLFYIIVGPIMGLFAWVGKRLHNRVDNMEKEIHKLETDTAVQYSRLKDIKKDIASLDKKQDKMDEKIDKILDKVIK